MHDRAFFMFLLLSLLLDQDEEFAQRTRKKEDL